MIIGFYGNLRDLAVSIVDCRIGAWMDTDKGGTRATRDVAGNSGGSNRESMAPPVFRERGPVTHPPSHLYDLCSYVFISEYFPVIVFLR
jgi:hypothetical protein